MENNPRLSIIVPIYNAEKYIDNCMRSIYDQTFTDYEIILVNDGSSDKSGEICRKYQESDPRVTYIEKENGGAGSARNAGMDSARGRYLAFPDADDSFEPEMYADLYALAESGDYDVVFSGVNYYVRRDGELVYSRTQNIKALSYTSREQCRENIMEFFPTTTIFDVPWNKLYKRSVVTENKIRFSDLRRCQDALFNLEFFDRVNSAASLDKAYYRYMENTAADVRRKFPKNYIDVNIAYYSRLMEMMRGWGVYDGGVRLHYDSTYVLSIYSTADRFDNPAWGLDREGQRRYIEDILNRREITEFLPSAIVRDDVKPTLKILLDKDVQRIIRLHKKEQFKENIRQNKLLIGLYRKLRG